MKLEERQQIAETIRELTIDLCIQTLLTRSTGCGNREDAEVRACVNTLKRLKDEVMK